MDTWTARQMPQYVTTGHLRLHSSAGVPAQSSTEKVRVSWDLAESYTQCCLCSLSSHYLTVCLLPIGNVDSTI